MEIHQVRYFLALCESLNFTRAAESCNVAQPSLTRAIKNLEDELGGPLFHRERNNTHLTDLGRLMRPYLTEAWETMSQARDRALDFVKLKDVALAVGVMATIGAQNLIGLLKQFRARHPGVSIHLKDGTGAQIESALVRGDLDIAIYGLPRIAEELHAHTLYEESFVVACPPGHRFERLDAVPMQAMSGEAYLTRAECECIGLFDKLLEERKIEMTYPYSSERESWIQSMILSGLGVSFVPEFMARLPGLIVRPLIEPVVRRQIQLITVRGRPHAPSVGAFVQLALRHDWSSRTAGSLA